MSRRGVNVYKRKDGRWEGRYVKQRRGQKTVFGYVFGRTYRETKQKRDRLGYEWRRYGEGGGKSTLDVISRQWMAEAELFLKESTINKYQYYISGYILPYFGRQKISKITNGNIMDFCRQLLESGGMAKQGLSPQTVTEVMRIIKIMYKYATHRGYSVGFDDGCFMLKPRGLRNAVRVLNTREEGLLRNYLLNNLNASNLGILLCLATGIRIGELCALRWDDISLIESKLYVKHTMQRIKNRSRGGNHRATKIIVTSPKSLSAVREIPLTEGLCIKLAPNYKAGTFFLTGDADKFLEPRTMQYHFQSVLKKCGLPAVKFHALRHTFASQCIEAGFDIKCLSEILGHASVNITLNRYVHPTMDLKRQNMNKLNII